MPLRESELQFVRDNPNAAMVTLDAGGTPKAVRVVVAMVDGRLWSTGTQDRIRTAHLRGDRRCTLFVFESDHGFLTIETHVSILDGPDAPRLNLAFVRARQGRPDGPVLWLGEELDEGAFLAQMIAEKRLIYEFEVARTYGRL